MPKINIEDYEDQFIDSPYSLNERKYKPKKNKKKPKEEKQNYE